MSKCDEFAKLMVDAGQTVENRSYIELACALEDKEKLIAELRCWIEGCKDQILYPLSFGDDNLAKDAEAFGSATVKLLGNQIKLDKQKKN